MNEKKPLKILFIKGSEIGTLIEYVLREEHHLEDQVISAVDIQDCKRQLREGKYDLLITGGRIQERGNAGLELTRFAKENCPGIRVIMMSSWTNAEEALAAGADRHWTGSSHVEELVEIIESLFPG